jgi:hypothetical protein
MPEEFDALVGRIRQADAQALAQFIDLRRGALLAFIERR